MTHTAPLIPYILTLQLNHQCRYNRPITNPEMNELIPQSGSFEETFLIYSIPPNLVYTKTYPLSESITVRKTQIFISLGNTNDKNFGCFTLITPNDSFIIKKFKFYKFTNSQQISQYLIYKSLKYIAINTDILVETELIIIYCANHIKVIPNTLPSFINNNTSKIYKFLNNYSQIKIIISKALPLNAIPCNIDINFTQSPSDSFIKHSYKFYNMSFINQQNNKYSESQIEHEYYTTNETFREFFPSHHMYKFLEHTFESTQFLTGHGSFGAFLHRLNIAPFESCLCDNLSPQTNKHILLNCPLFTQTIVHFYHTQPTNLNHFINTKQNFSKFLLLCKTLAPPLRTQHTYT